MRPFLRWVVLPALAKLSALLIMFAAGLAFAHQGPATPQLQFADVMLVDGEGFTNVVAPPAASPVATNVHEALVDLLMAVATGLLALGAAWVRAHAQNSKFAGALMKGTELVETYVAKAEVELKPMFKSFLSDGKIDALEAQQLKAKVLEIVKRDMPASLWSTLQSGFGPAVDGWLSGKIEQAVEAQKRE